MRSAGASTPSTREGRSSRSGSATICIEIAPHAGTSSSSDGKWRYVLDGSVTIEVGDETVELGPGQHAFGPRDIPHRFTVGPDGARMIWVLTPSGFEDFVEEVSAPAETPTVPPASARCRADAAEIVLRHGMELLPG